MRDNRLNFGVVIRAFVSLLPMLFGVPTLAVITCGYNIVMSFVVFGPLSAFATSLCSVCISMLIGEFAGAGGELAGFVIAIEAVLAAAGCIYGYLIKKKFLLGIYCASAGVLIPEFLHVKSLAASSGLSVTESLVPTIDEVNLIVNEIMASNAESGVNLGTYEINLISNMARRITAMIIPSFFIIISLVIAYIIVWAISAQLRKVSIERKNSFSHIRVTRTMSIALIVFLNALAVILVLNNLAVPESVTMVLLNMVLIIASICFFAGISFVDFYLRKGIRFTALRVLIYAGTLMFFPAVSVAYLLAGCVDSFADFRKLRKIYNKKGEFDEAEK